MKRPVRALASPGNLTRACHKPLICQVHETWNIWSNVYFFAVQNSRNEKKWKEMIISERALLSI